MLLSVSCNAVGAARLRGAWEAVHILWQGEQDGIASLEVQLLAPNPWVLEREPLQQVFVRSDGPAAVAVSVWNSSLRELLPVDAAWDLLPMARTMGCH